MRHLELLDLHKTRKAHFDFNFCSTFYLGLLFGALDFNDSNVYMKEAILKIIMMVHSERYRLVVISPASCSARLRFKSLLEARLS